jgi:hypothetical protein
MLLMLLAVLLTGEPGAPDAGVAKEAPSRTERLAPAALLRYLRQLTLAGPLCDAARWTEPAPLSVSRTFELKDGGLLLIVQVPDYQCTSSNGAVPVIVPAVGEWRWGAPMGGELRHLLRSDDGQWWAATQWQIEGTTPLLFTSADGLSWMEVPLPTERVTSGPAEILGSLCASHGKLVVHLVDPDGPAQAAFSRDASGGGVWSKEEGDFTGCEALKVPHRWRELSSPDRLLFQGERMIVSLPKLLRQR